MGSGDSRVDGCHNKVGGERSCALLTFSLKYGNVLWLFQTLRLNWRMISNYCINAVELGLGRVHRIAMGMATVKVRPF